MLYSHFLFQYKSVEAKNNWTHKYSDHECFHDFLGAINLYWKRKREHNFTELLQVRGIYTWKALMILIFQKKIEYSLYLSMMQWIFSLQVL